MKNIVDVFNESILDQGFEETIPEMAIKDWFVKHCGENAGKAMSFDKDGRVVFPKRAWVRFAIDDEIPDFIKIASCDEMTIQFRMNGDITIPDGFLPESLDDLEIGIFTEKPGKLYFETDSLIASRFVMRGSASELILPKKFTCDEFNVTDAENLVDIKNMAKIKKANFPSKLGANLIRKYLKFPGEIKINGFGPY